MSHEEAKADASRGGRVEIREVWAHNLDEEMAVIREVVDKYPYVAMVCSNCWCVLLLRW